MRGLMIGRFQPFHLGHLALARQILDECDGLIVAVASSQFNYIPKDPFTAGERIEMIHDSLVEAQADMGRCHVVALENRPDVATWASYLRSALPRFERVYSGNDYVSMILSDSGMEVVMPKLADRDSLNATDIRAMMASGGPWKERVPDAVYRYLTGINAEERLAVIARSDTNPTEH